MTERHRINRHDTETAVTIAKVAEMHPKYLKAMAIKLAKELEIEWPLKYGDLKNKKNE